MVKDEVQGCSEQLPSRARSEVGALADIVNDAVINRHLAERLQRQLDDARARTRTARSMFYFAGRIVDHADGAPQAKLMAVDGTLKIQPVSPGQIGRAHV